MDIPHTIRAKVQNHPGLMQWLRTAKPEDYAPKEVRMAWDDSAVPKNPTTPEESAVTLAALKAGCENAKRELRGISGLEVTGGYYCMVDVAGTAQQIMDALALGIIKEALFQPIPTMQELRERPGDYGLDDPPVSTRGRF